MQKRQRWQKRRNQMPMELELNAKCNKCGKPTKLTSHVVIAKIERNGKPETCITILDKIPKPETVEGLIELARRMKEFNIYCGQSCLTAEVNDLITKINSTQAKE
jgi:hypothetical protein